MPAHLAPLGHQHCAGGLSAPHGYEWHVQRGQNCFWPTNRLSQVAATKPGESWVTGNAIPFKRSAKLAHARQGRKIFPSDSTFLGVTTISWIPSFRASSLFLAIFCR